MFLLINSPIMDSRSFCNSSSDSSLSGSLSPICASSASSESGALFAASAYNTSKGNRCKPNVAETYNM